MNAILIVLAVFFAVGVALGVYMLVAPRKAAPVEVPPVPAGGTADTGWTAAAGAEFAGLSESARCDLVFAVSDLNDERSREMLLHALDDPSDAVALAAAHALCSRGEESAVSEYASRHPGERAQRILDTIALLR